MKNGLCFALSFVIILLDQASKYWAQLSLTPYQSQSFLPMIDFTLAYNTGAAFSFLSSSGDWHRWFFAGFSLIMSGVLIVWIIRASANAYLQLVALSLILGGALGNLIDRALLGHVVDFIDVYYKNHHWPVFNLADSAICLGAFLLFIDLMKNPQS